MADKMKPEWKAKWQAALLGGDYQQGTAYLTQIMNDGKRLDCCLGVLCDIVLKEYPGLIPFEEYEVVLGPRVDEKGDDVIIGKAYAYDANACTLPTAVLAVTGVEESNPTVVIPYEDGRFENANYMTTFSAVNDGLKYTFAQIAELIEAQL